VIGRAGIKHSTYCTCLAKSPTYEGLFARAERKEEENLEKSPVRGFGPVITGHFQVAHLYHPNGDTEGESISLKPRKGRRKDIEMKKILTTYLPASLLLAFLTMVLLTCGGGGGGSLGNTAPTVLWTIPDNNAVDVSIGTTITVAFSVDMDSSTVNVTNFTVSDGGGPVAGTIFYSQAFGSDALFTPTDPLEPSTTYTATVTTGVTNKAGNALAQDYTWSFTTGAAPTGFTPEMLEGKAFASINEQPFGDYDDWVIQFDTETFNYWEAQFTSGPDTVVPTVGQGNWSISNGELIVDFPSKATVTLLDITATYFDVQIDDGINPPENVRLYKTNPFVEADVIGHTFDYGIFTEVFNADHTGTQFDISQPPQVSNFTWSIVSGALKQTYETDNHTNIGYRLFNPDPNIVFAFIDENEAFLSVFHSFYTDSCGGACCGCWDY
jgi:hypothetical protein